VLNQPHLSKGAMELPAHDNMIQHVDAENLGRFAKTSRNRQISLGRLWFTARAIMHQNDRIGPADNSEAEDNDSISCCGRVCYYSHIPMMEDE
jgi:hypothetical protein